MSALADRGLEAWRRLSPLDKGFLASVLLHGGLWFLFSWEHRVRITDEAVSAFEIDLSRPFRITDDPSKARRAEKPGAGAPVVQKPTPIAGKGVAGGEETAPAPEAKGPAPEWVLPTPQTKQVEPPQTGEAAGAPEGLGEGAGLGGLGGVGDGEVDWIYLTGLPKLINREQVLRDMVRFYPEEENRAGREARVVMDVHINAEGRVVSVTVSESGGAHFDEAARKVLSRARFVPARVGEKAVPVKMKQSLDFTLQ